MAVAFASLRTDRINSERHLWPRSLILMSRCFAFLIDKYRTDLPSSLLSMRPMSSRCPLMTGYSSVEDLVRRLPHRLAVHLRLTDRSMQMSGWRQSCSRGFGLSAKQGIQLSRGRCAQPTNHRDLPQSIPKVHILPCNPAGLRGP